MILATWTKLAIAGRGLETLRLTQEASGRTLIERCRGRGQPYKAIYIPVPREERLKGQAFTERPTLAQAERYALANGYERRRA